MPDAFLDVLDTLPTPGLHMAETDGSTVSVKSGWQHGRQGLLRLLHELEHVRDMTAPHHPWWHFCVRAKVPLRRYACTQLPLDLAERLRSEGRVSW